MLSVRHRMSPIVALAACLALLLASLVTSPPASAATAGATLTLSRTAGVAGETLVARGVMPPKKARTVRLERYVSGRWTLVASKKATSTGTYSFSTKVVGAAGTRQTYRVLAPRATIGSRTYVAATTPTRTVLVQKQTAALSMPASAAKGTTARATMSFTPVRQRRAVRLQRQVGTSWVTVVSAAQSTTGKASVTFTVPSSGTHRYRAQALASGGAPTVTSAVRTLHVIVPDTTAPSVPVNVKATGGDRSVALSWGAVSASDLKGYRVYRASSASGPWSEVTAAPVVGTSYLVSGLTNGTAYFFAVVSVDQVGNASARSAAVSATPVAPADTTAPSVPVNVKATGGDRSVALSWGAVSASDLKGYRVYRASSASGPWSEVTAAPVVGTSYLVSGLTNGTAYFFAVVSVDQVGNASARSAAVSATAVAPANVVERCGTISSSETWPASQVTVLTCPVKVPQGVSVTLAPGAVVKAAYGSELRVEGSLVASGTSGAPVVLTSLRDDVGGDTNGDGTASVAGAGDWRGVVVDSGVPVSWSQVRVKYTAGHGEGTKVSSRANITVKDSVFEGGLSVTQRGDQLALTVSGNRVAGELGVSQLGSSSSTTVTGNTVGEGDLSVLVDYGTNMLAPTVTGNTLTSPQSVLWVRSRGLLPSQLTGNVLDQRGSYIMLDGKIDASWTIPAAGPRWVFGDVVVAEGKTLTIPAGYVLKFRNAGDSRGWGGLRVEGSLVASGTSGAPVVLTSLRDDVGGDTNGDGTASVAGAGDWRGLSASEVGDLHLTHTSIRYAPLTSEGGTVDASGLSFRSVGDQPCVSVGFGASAKVAGDFSGCTTAISSAGYVDARNVQWGNNKGPGVNGNPQIQGSVEVYPWVGAPAPPRYVTTPTAAWVPDYGKCKPNVVIALRGSGESIALTGTPDGVGETLRHVVDGITNGSGPNTSTSSYEVIGLPYEANPVPIQGWDIVDLYKIGNYVPGAWDGAVKLILRLDMIKTRCGGESVNVILIGYSQGAWSIHAAMSYLNAVDSELYDFVDEVGVVADPLRSRYDYTSNIGTASIGSGIANQLVGAGWASWNDMLGILALRSMPSVPKVKMSGGQWGAIRVVELCDDDDVVCDFNYLGDFDSGIATHSAYATDRQPALRELGNALMHR